MTLNETQSKHAMITTTDFSDLKAVVQHKPKREDRENRIPTCYSLWRANHVLSQWGPAWSNRTRPSSPDSLRCLSDMTRAGGGSGTTGPKLWEKVARSRYPDHPDAEIWLGEESPPLPCLD